jgi:hypothetical protein
MWKFIKFNRRAWLAGCVVAFFVVMQFAIAKTPGDPDAYYHAQASRLLVRGELGPQFPWLTATTLAQGYADQHYVFHFLLYPFTGIKGLPWGIVLFSSSAVLGFFLLLKSLDLKGKGLWLVLLVLGSVDFLFRINVVKANTLSLVLLFATIIILARQRYVYLLPLALLFVWTYGGFVFLPFIVGLCGGFEFYQQKKLVWQPLAYTLAGVFLGILLHPHASHLPLYLYNQIFHAGLGAGKAVSVGVEWEAYSLANFVRINGLIALAWGLSSIHLFYVSVVDKDKNSKAQSWWLWSMSALFFALTVKSRRFTEYWVPFAVLFAAWEFQPYIRKLTWQALQKAWQEWQFRIAVCLSVAVIFVIGYANLKLTRDYFAGSPRPDLYQKASQWLAKNSQPGDIVFNPQWDQFPQLFYWNPKNYYIVGLDPTFMYLNDKDLYWQWRLVSDDGGGWGSQENLHRIVKEKFNSRYVFVELSRNPKLEKDLHGDPSGLFAKVYSDDEIAIYEVK